MGGFHMKKKKSLFERIKNVFSDIKQNPDPLKSAIMSFFIMGLGQFRNKQKSKAAVFFGVLLVFLLAELLTGSYQFALDEMSRFPADPGTPIYFFRDYGGMISKGLWGLFTLGKVPGQIFYRGQFVETFNKTIPWLTADNSVTLLGTGLIALILSGIFLSFWTMNVRDAYISRKAHLRGEKIETGLVYVRRLWSDMFPYIVLIPALIMILFFTLIPFLFSFLLAFTNYTYRIPIPNQLIKWVGFDTFKLIVADAGWFKIFSQVLGWTFVYAIMASATCYILGMIQAIIIE